MLADFPAAFRTALETNVSEPELAEIVLRYKALGLNQQEAYSALERMRVEWCNGEQPETPTCEILEAIMDRVWGYCSQSRRLWSTALSETSRKQ